MKTLNVIWLALALLFSTSVNISYAAENTDPLLINMTTDDMHRSEMAIGFGKNQLLRGHPLIIFMNDKGVMVASKKNSQHYASQQKMIESIIAAGGVVYVCPSCMKFYKVDKSDLVKGVHVSNPDLMEKALFQDELKTLTW